MKRIVPQIKEGTTIYNDNEIENEIKSTKKKVKLVLSLVATLFLVLILYGIYSIQRPPKGDFIEQSTSPKGTYTVKTFLINGGATTDFAVRGELIFNKNKSKCKNIYWEYHTSKSNIYWIDENTISINGHEISLPYGKYDYRYN
ncbi:hypothetical protein J5Y03_00850 [Bacillus sp. RG28]|uniref:DUF5412 domain-containing protein n=1 Tax=Gottfriedia endophytica TaxID=2820819 RepID=A0A940NLN9_9BACI|nr:DUF5412 family protein [Gottfriedia endophytica]MBP0723728.1 hypothetical protein [Gottfriedia endophytica]